MFFLKKMKGFVKAFGRVNKQNTDVDQCSLYISLNDIESSECFNISYLKNIYPYFESADECNLVVDGYKYVYLYKRKDKKKFFVSKKQHKKAKGFVEEALRSHSETLESAMFGIQKKLDNVVEVLTEISKK